MFKMAVQKVWKDPVWSKVISVGIVALLTLLYNVITATRQKTSLSIAFYNFWTYKISLWVASLLLSLLLAIHFLLKKNFKYDQETLELDRKLFHQLRYGNGIEDLILDIKSNCFSCRPVRFERISAIIEVLENSKKVDFEFFNPRLDKLKRDFIKELVNLDLTLDNYIFGMNNPEWVSIPSEWEFNQPERLREAQKIIAQKENAFTISYQNFISEGRKILKV